MVPGGISDFSIMTSSHLRITILVLLVSRKGALRSQLALMSHQIGVLWVYDRSALVYFGERGIRRAVDQRGVSMRQHPGQRSSGSFLARYSALYDS
ncbi:hypothetical protein GCM10027075_78110 [Streptomyces heilongjiangensis]